MKTRHYFLVIFISLFSTIGGLVVWDQFREEKISTIVKDSEAPVRFASYQGGGGLSGLPDLRYAANNSLDAVVHVKTISMRQQTGYSNPFEQFFGPNDPFHFFFDDRGRQGPQKATASGSGVIISSDGYIVTNNHVIDAADEVEVTLHNNSSYKATVVGADPNTDLALLKIEGSGFHFLEFANSDSLEIGDWVLAVGNPFNLSSTVTAGIVSAKGRSINILESQAAIESFIQTDAAVNPGNSGGALVNTLGNLVGINTAIASPTGSYSGYSFAVPSNLVYKVVNDIKEFGIVQRGFLGVNIRNIDSELAEELKLDEISGVYIEDVVDGSAAHDAGIQKGDVIKRINGIKIASAPKLQEVVGQYRPGDELSVEYIHDGKLKTTTVLLKNKNQSTELLSKTQSGVLDLLGVELRQLPDTELRKLGLSHGLEVQKIFDGKIKKYTDIKEGFIITRVDRSPVKGVDELISVLEGRKGGVLLEGVYPNYPGSYYYALGM